MVRTTFKNNKTSNIHYQIKFSSSSKILLRPLYIMLAWIDSRSIGISLNIVKGTRWLPLFIPQIHCQYKGYRDLLSNSRKFFRGFNEVIRFEIHWILSIDGLRSGYDDHIILMIRELQISNVMHILANGISRNHRHAKISHLCNTLMWKLL